MQLDCRDCKKPKDQEKKKKRALKFEGGIQIPQLFLLNHLFIQTMEHKIFSVGCYEYFEIYYCNKKSFSNSSFAYRLINYD